MDNIREQVLGLLTTCNSITATTPGNFTFHTIISLDFLSIIFNDVILSLDYTSVGCKLDIAFILDDTTSVSSSEFTDMKSFLKSLVTRMVVSDTAVRIGVVTFGDNAETAFALNQYSTSADVIAGIESLSRASGSYGRSYRYVDRALEYTLTKFFTKANGDRYDAADYYVVVTHGYSYGLKTTTYGTALRAISSAVSDIFIVGKVPFMYVFRSEIEIYP
jgi:hypothetical protein